MDLLYTSNPDIPAVVFAERTLAEKVARIHAALDTATTWGEFAAGMPEDEYRDILDNMGQEPEEVEPQREFHRDDVPGVADGDYPLWLQAEALKWFPKDLVAKYGVEESVLNGDYLELPEDAAEERSRANWSHVVIQ